jgi:hypothetical protein
MLAREFAEVLWYSLTEFSMIPVMGGNMNPPKNSSSQMNIANTWKLDAGIQGIGIAESTAHIPTQHCMYWAFRVL